MRDTYTYMNLEGSGDILACRRNTPASRFFFSSFFFGARAKHAYTYTRTHRLLLPSSVRLFFPPLYARRSSGGERGAESQREDDDDSPESSGSSGRAGCNIRRLPRRGGRRIIQNYLVFSLSSSSSFLSPLALGSVSSAARNSVKAWRGFKNKKQSPPPPPPPAPPPSLQKLSLDFFFFFFGAHNPKSVRSESRLWLPSAPSVYLRGIPTPCTGHFFFGGGSAADGRSGRRKSNKKKRRKRRKRNRPPSIQPQLIRIHKGFFCFNVVCQRVV